INKMLATIWGLFDEYEDAEAALAELNRLEVPAEARNAILQESVAKNRSPVDLNKVGVAAAGQFGDRLLSGLDRLVLNQRPVPLTDVGEVYAGGQLATIMTDAAVAPGQPAGLKAALVAFGVPERTAEDYAGGVL